MSATMAAKIDGRHVLACLLGFFGVMFAVNAVFVYFALTTFGGRITEDAYRKGLAYNATLAEATIQTALAWQPVLSYDDQTATLSVKVLDRAAAPVTGLSIAGVLRRPATDAYDRTLARFEEHAGGVYMLRMEALGRGAWIADLTLQQTAERSFRMRERLWLAPKS